MQFITVTKARSSLRDLTTGHEVVTLTNNGQPISVLLPIREYESLRALVALANNPTRFVEVIGANQRFKAGDMDGAVALQDLDSHCDGSL